jgi:hypothetical protein
VVRKSFIGRDTVNIVTGFKSKVAKPAVERKIRDRNMIPQGLLPTPYPAKHCVRQIAPRPIVEKSSAVC